MNINPRKYLCLGVLSLLLSFAVISQNNPLIFETSSYFGTPLKHSSKILFNTNVFSWGQDLDVKWQTIGKKKWQEKHHYPRLGIQLNYQNLGEPDTLGIAIGAVPNLSFALIKKERWDFRFQIGYGLAYVNKIYDDLTNPLNNSISSKVNANVILKLENQFQLNPNWWLKAGANFIHYSNGANKVPNLGINVTSLNLGVSYRPIPITASDFLKDGVSKFIYKKWGVDLQMGLGLRERGPSRGPVFPIYSTSAALVFRPNITNHMRLGIEYEYNHGVFILSKRIWLFDNDEDARMGAKRMNVFYAHEFRFGPLGLYLSLGINISKKSVMLSSNIHNKYTVRYYFPTIGKPKTSFYCGLNLKVNTSIAEYYSLSAGAVF